METYECQRCYFKGQLDQHGRCARCQSDSVISLAKIERTSVDGFSPEYWTLQGRIQTAVREVLREG